MKNITLYKDLKFKKNFLKFKKDIIYKFDVVSIADEYSIEDIILKMKKYLSYEKKYISEHIDYKIIKEKNLITLELKCKDEDNYVYVKKIEFVSFLKNQIVIL